ncbi:MAG: S1-like domain-containing RNA-binding protein [Peptostreptococcaceae bacterium]|jgi:predicted RNA-binding protein (virulence factor B family)|nr:S1-like domain-containing RNA-binding protein [Peptostreptococcaceae bacterium]
MIELGKLQTLIVDRIVSSGYFLTDEERTDDILLPGKFVDEELELDDEIEVFVYKDSKGRPIATLKKPYVNVGEIGFLNVVDVTKFGAFLDWGIDKDVFMPFKEQRRRAEVGKRYLVGIYLDKSQRFCATMKIYNFLKPDAPYEKDDMVKGTIYQKSEELGLLVAVDNKYHGLIPKNEVINGLKLGDEIEARVSDVREDGKIILAIRDKAHNMIDKDAQVILDKLMVSKGELKVNDKSSPEVIKNKFNISKKAFKRAIGSLYKKRMIEFTDNGIKLSNKNK